MTTLPYSPSIDKQVAEAQAFCRTHRWPGQRGLTCQLIMDALLTRMAEERSLRVIMSVRDVAVRIGRRTQAVSAGLRVLTGRIAQAGIPALLSCDDTERVLIRKHAHRYSLENSPLEALHDFHFPPESAHKEIRIRDSVLTLGENLDPLVHTGHNAFRGRRGLPKSAAIALAAVEHLSIRRSTALCHIVGCSRKTAERNLTLLQHHELLYKAHGTYHRTPLSLDTLARRLGTARYTDMQAHEYQQERKQYQQTLAGKKKRRVLVDRETGERIRTAE